MHSVCEYKQNACRRCVCASARARARTAVAVVSRPYDEPPHAVSVWERDGDGDTHTHTRTRTHARARTHTHTHLACPAIPFRQPASMAAGRRLCASGAAHGRMCVCVWLLSIYREREGGREGGRREGGKEGGKERDKKEVGR
jgi:hypothetical protein